MYEKGQAVNRDIQKAADLYKKSAEQDNALGQLRLGDFYLNGLGVEQRPRKAFAWYQKAAAQDKDPEIASQAQQRLGAMYCQGNGVEKDLKKGFEFYEMAARLDNAEAQFCLGAMYEDGVGVERDHKKALEWFQKSSKKSKAPSDRAMGDIYRDGLIVEKNIPEAIKWYKKAADEGDAYAKTELLKLQLEESAPKKAQAAPAPAGREDARAAAAVAQPATTAAEKPRKKVEEKPAKTAEKAELPARGKLQPAPPPKSAKLRTGKKIPEKTVQKNAPEQAGQIEKAHAPKRRLVAFSAIGMIAVSLAAVFIGLGNKSGPILESLELKAAEITALPRPDPGSIPPLALAPAGDFLKRIHANKTSLKKGPAPIVEAAKPVARTEPAATRLRREYTSLDEEEVANMLAARNIFDAERNPGGSFPHRYEIKNDSGLRLIVDRATNLVWTRQQNPVKMNLKKSMDGIASLNNADYGGIKNWRLPTIEEAAALLKKDGGKTFLDAIFGKEIDAIWTGDGFSDSESWIVDFKNGQVDHAKNKSRLVIVMVSSEPD